MIATRIAPVVGVLVLAAPLSLHAQQGTPVAPGDRVRVSVVSHASQDGDRLIGYLRSLSSDSLLLELEKSSQAVAVPLTDVTKLEVSQGTYDHSGTGALIGLVAGLGAGIFTAAVILGDSCSDTSFVCIPSSVFAVPAFMIGGVAIGAVIGSKSTSEQWEEAPVGEIRVGMTPRGGGLEVSAKFVF